MLAEGEIDAERLRDEQRRQRHVDVGAVEVERVARAHEAGARLHEIADHQSDHEREGGDDLEQRLDADAADLLGVLDVRDAGDDGAEL